MMVFSYESSSLGRQGQRLFLACGVQSFFHYYRQMNPSARCHYEVIPTYRPAKLYLDLEFYVDRNPGADAEKAASTFVRAVRSALHFFYNVQVSPPDILVLDARSYVLLRHPVPKCQCVSPMSCQAGRDVPVRSHSPVSSSHSQNLPPDLCDFVRTVLTDWSVRGQRANPRTAGDYVALKQWRIHHLDMHCFSVTLDGLRFCERVGRPHRSNHVILVFDLSQRIYYQKCLDPDCRAVNFRSQSWPLPPNLCATNSEPRQTANSFNDPDVTADDLILCGVADMVDVYFEDNF
ncbi:uncharacterized protein DEA37_0007959 [Paragonimus westermani]|uniref:DNA-directed primase/polymerase protein n=1 Tax=Paragonimus westermani TaxID=34504 RepID=A0A5J4NGD4_9TREM|nr:uncharacterized protein DEA37_0007959 [Paragonimus westermani]